MERKHVAIVVTVIGTAAAIVYPMDNITDFLYLIGSVFAPMIAIQIADFFLLKLDKSNQAVHVPNMIIWVIGFIAYRILMNIDMPVGNTLPDMVITIILCLIVGKLFPGKQKAVSPFSSGTTTFPWISGLAYCINASVTSQPSSVIQCAGTAFSMLQISFTSAVS